MTGFPAALHAVGPAEDRSDALGLYGFLVGDWRTEVIFHLPQGGTAALTGEIHAGWVLEGRAVQDIWLTHRDRPAPFGHWYGTTLRLYDSSLNAWRILWSNPCANTYRQQIGRRRGDEIVQEGTVETGGLSRWRFTRMQPDSVHWLGEASADDGAAWRLQVEVLARRV